MGYYFTHFWFRSPKLVQPHQILKYCQGLMTGSEKVSRQLVDGSKQLKPRPQRILLHQFFFSSSSRWHCLPNKATSTNIIPMI